MKFKFGMSWEMYGTKEIEVPEEITTISAAEDYVKKNWDSIPLPETGNYIIDSDKPDFEVAEFVKDD